MATIQAMGAFNGIVPVATGIVVGQMRNPKLMPYLRYAQFVPAPAIIFSYTKIDPNVGTRLPNMNAFAWGYDDDRPQDKTFQIRYKMEESRIRRFNFTSHIGNATQSMWQNQGINYQALANSIRINQAHTHRAQRCLDALGAANWVNGFNSGTPQTLLGADQALYFDDSSGTQRLVTGAKDPHFQVIRRTLQEVHRKMMFNTSNAITVEQFKWVMDPYTALVVSRSGEMVDFLKGSPAAKEITPEALKNYERYGLPGEYAGFEIVVEDTIRTYTPEQLADEGEVDDVAQGAGLKDYILSPGTSYFLCRVSSQGDNNGLDGISGVPTYNTLQIYTLNGEARVEAFSDAENDKVRSHIVLEDRPVVPTTVSGFRLTGYLDPENL